MADDTSDLLKKLNEEMYRQNVELSVRNKTLTILRHLSTQSLQSLDVTEVSQTVANIVALELGAIFTLVSLCDPKKETLHHRAITQNAITVDAIKNFDNPLALHAIDATHTNNLLMKAIVEKTEQQGKCLMEIFAPFVTQQECDTAQTSLQVTEFSILPIILDGVAMGTLTIALSKPLEEFSAAERESLGQITLVVALAIDRARLYEETVRNNKKLQELDKLKDEFLSVASHDLRTPMTSIKGYLYLMIKKSNQLAPDMSEKLQRIYNSSERMIALINDMLNVQRIEGGRMQMVFEVFDIVPFAKDVIEELSGIALERNLNISFTTNAPQYIIRADKNRLHEVLTNLIGNAIKFTPIGGSIVITIDSQEKHVRVSVKDTGIGVAKKDLPVLFTKFGRIDTTNSKAAQVPGTGLGLYICKKIIQLSNGEISAESEAGVGSTFTFTVPLAEG